MLWLNFLCYCQSACFIGNISGTDLYEWQKGAQLAKIYKIYWNKNDQLIGHWPLDIKPWTLTPWILTPLDIDPPGHWPPGHWPPWTLTPLDIDPPGHWPLLSLSSLSNYKLLWTICEVVALFFLLCNTFLLFLLVVETMHWYILCLFSVLVPIDNVAELNYALTRSPDFNDSYVMSYHKVSPLCVELKVVSVKTLIKEFYWDWKRVTCARRNCTKR